MQADALADIKTEANSLSFYLVRDDQSNLFDVVAAIAAKRDNVAVFDYVIVDKQRLSELSVEVRATKGDSLCEQVNEWHFDLIQLTADKIMSLAQVISDGSNRDRLNEREVYALVSDALRSGHVQKGELRKTMNDDLEKLSTKYNGKV